MINLVKESLAVRRQGSFHWSTLADVSRAHRSSWSARRKAAAGAQEICASNNISECKHTV